MYLLVAVWGKVSVVLLDSVVAVLTVVTTALATVVVAAAV